MTITNGYTTLAAFKLRDNITSSDSNDDLVIEDMIEKASRAIDLVTHRRFYAETKTLEFTATNTRLCFVDDLLSVTTLKTDTGGDLTFDNTWATTDYWLMPANAQAPSATKTPYRWLQVTPQGNKSFPTQERAVEIAGSFGYAAATPEMIELVCQIVVSSELNKRFGEGETGQTIITPSAVIITPESFPKRAKDYVRPFIRREVVSI